MKKAKSGLKRAAPKKRARAARFNVDRIKQEDLASARGGADYDD